MRLFGAAISFGLLDLKQKIAGSVKIIAQKHLQTRLNEICRQ